MVDYLSNLTTTFTAQIEKEPEVNPDTPEVTVSNITDYVTLA